MASTDRMFGARSLILILSLPWVAAFSTPQLHTGRPAAVDRGVLRQECCTTTSLVQRTGVRYIHQLLGINSVNCQRRSVYR
ncbi:hypothetical protein DFS34DRAFT_269398 [Phlyctochytrium arcticum]|nr:hypothetical protein DFS34DRAFT_269398 [Phlyctochytrium arcticum]